jgi:hypothetical protein
MKTYLAITGTLFGLIAFAHGWKAFDDRQSISTSPGEYFSMAALGVIAAALSIWGWRLFCRQLRKS